MFKSALCFYVDIKHLKCVCVCACVWCCAFLCVATCQRCILAGRVPNQQGLIGTDSQQAWGGGVEEDQLQPAATRPQSQLRLAGLLQLRIAQTPQPHLNTHTHTDRRRVSWMRVWKRDKSDFAESNQPGTPGSAHPLNHSGFLRARHSWVRPGLGRSFGSRWNNKPITSECWGKPSCWARRCGLRSETRQIPDGLDTCSVGQNAERRASQKV